MKSHIEKRELLSRLAETYLNTKEDSYISINDGIMNSHDFDSITFLMFLALTYSNQEVASVYSVDIDVSDDAMKDFVEKEYSKIIKLKHDEITLGQIILQDAKDIYLLLYDKENNDGIDEIGKKFFL